jgi:hypothetical protein
MTATVRTNDATSRIGVSALTTFRPWRDAACITSRPMKPNSR